MSGVKLAIVWRAVDPEEQWIKNINALIPHVSLCLKIYRNFSTVHLGEYTGDYVGLFRLEYCRH